VLKKFKSSFRAKMLAAIIAAIFFSGAGISGTIIYSQYQSQMNQMKIDGVNIARVTAKTIEDAAKYNLTDTLAAVQAAVDGIGKSEGMQYALVLDKNLVDICDSEQKDIGKSFKDDQGSINTVVNRKVGTSFWTNDNGQKVLDAQIPVDFKIGDKEIASVDIGISLAEMNKNINSSIWKSCLLALFFIILFSIIPAFIINIMAIKPLRKGAVLAEAIENKDLTMEYVPKVNDEIGVMIKAIDSARNNLKIVINEAQESAHDVASASDVLSFSLNSIVGRTEKMTIFVDSMSKDMENNINIVGETNSAMESVTLNSKKAEEASTEVGRFINVVKESAIIGKDSVEEIVKTIEGIAASTNKVNEVIRELEAETVKIGDIVSVITQISEQTNLLALNAAIEAARAGDAGKGFAVVADEVRKLAEQSGQSLSGIIELTSNIQNKTEKVVDMVATTNEKVGIGVTKSNITSSNINKIIENVENVVNNISAISDMTEKQSKSIEVVQTLINKITESAKTGVDSAQEMSAEIEEEMGVVEEINATGEEMKRLAAGLDEIVSQFKL
jgi:methyl-accepting chemotaxis protein